MRREFLYWYPVDLRVSAKELVPNHLTFFMFQHVALFPPEHWPKAIGVNGMLMIEGKQMHKSKGNFVTMKNAVEKYGADATRCALMLSAEDMDDPDWRSENVQDMKSKLESLYNFTKTIIENAKSEEKGHLEKWLMSVLQHRISEVTKNLEEMKTRTALEIAFFEIWNDFRWYIRRKGKADTKTLKKALKTWIKLLTPFAPHLCEEIWSLLGEKTFISTSSWPKPNKNWIDEKTEESEHFTKNVIDDTKSIIRATKLKPSKIYYYTAAPWKWKLYLRIIEKIVQEKVEVSMLIRELLKEPELRKNIKEAAKIAPKIAEEAMRMPEAEKKRQLNIEILNEKEILKNAKTFLKREFKAEIYIFQENDPKRYDPKQRAKLAKPYRPAIFIE